MKPPIALIMALLLVASLGVWRWVSKSSEPTKPLSVDVAVTDAQGAVPEPDLRTPAVGDTGPSPVEEIKGRLYRAATERGDPVEREAFLQKAVRGIPRALYASLVAALSSATDPLEGEIARAILLRWAWEEPTNVAGWAIDHGDSPFRQEALAVAAQRWAEVNPSQLLQWSAGLAPADRQWVLLRSGDYLGRTDPALFAVWQQAIQPGRERDQLELAIAREWSQRDPAEIATALSTNTGAEFESWRRLTVAGLTNHLATMKGAEAARFVSEKLSPGPTQHSAAMGAVVAWAREDPVATSEWIESFPADELRAQASQVLLGYWLESDRAAAESFAASLPAGPVSDQAHERVAQFLASTSGADAVSWAERIEDPTKKQQTLAFVISEWQRQDPVAVQLLLRQRPELAIAPAPQG
jgi:hypothetical protein